MRSCCLDVRTPLLVRSIVRVTIVGTTLTHTRSPVTHWVVLTEHWQSSTSWSLHTVQLRQVLSRTGTHGSLSNWPGWHTVQSWQIPSWSGEKVPGVHMATNTSELSILDMDWKLLRAEGGLSETALASLRFTMMSMSALETATAIVPRRHHHKTRRILHGFRGGLGAHS
jgi:hypothetical protein